MHKQSTGVDLRLRPWRYRQNVFMETIIYSLRAEGKIVLAVASSGVASLLLPWLLDIGNGLIGTPDDLDPENTSRVDIPDSYRIPDDENGMVNLISSFMMNRHSKTPHLKHYKKRTTATQIRAEDQYVDNTLV
nr:DNA helicase [Tanacetum cinerariifolium]